MARRSRSVESAEGTVRLRSVPREDMSFVRTLGEQAFSRAAGAPLVAGNQVRLLRDATENYPAWQAAIAQARSYVHFESYIVYDDAAGRAFGDALIERAQAGVHVRVLYDWLGALGKRSGRLWRRLRAGGVDVRCFNPPRLVSPLAWLSRDHRKSLVVDGEVGFVSGLCVGDKWTGDPAHGIQPWRDTGIELRGPAVADLVRAFARVWAAAGRPLPRETAHPRRLADAGTAAVRVIATEPNTTALYRLDQLIAATARRTLWLCDAYFAATPVYMQALRAAAADGVDVRLLVPGASDIPIMRNLARTAYRPLLEAGVRVFEWNGPMMHAKTAVADGRWARVGSSNLNIASWLGNWELDVAVEDEAFAEEMEASFDRDLAEATEIVLRAGLRARPRWGAAGVGDTPAARQRGRGQRSLASARTGVASVGGAIGAAVADRRPLGGVEQPIVLGGGLALLVLAALLLWFPRIAALPIALLAAWFGVGLVARAWHMRRRPRKRAASSAD